MRSLWNGSISFGLVHIPVKMYAATSRERVKFRYLHGECHTPIRYQKTCPQCQREITDNEIVYGYEYEKGRYVIIDEEELEALPSKQGRTIDIVDFVELSEIDPVYFDKTYYLEPKDGGAKPYVLLLQSHGGNPENRYCQSPHPFQRVPGRPSGYGECLDPRNDVLSCGGAGDILADGAKQTGRHSRTGTGNGRQPDQ